MPQLSWRASRGGGAQPRHARDLVRLVRVFSQLAILPAERPKPEDRFRVQLANARFGDAEQLANLAQGVVLLVIEIQERLQPLRQLPERIGQPFATLRPHDEDVGSLTIVPQLHRIAAVGAPRIEADQTSEGDDRKSTRLNS